MEKAGESSTEQDEERVMNAKDDDGEKTRVAIIMIKSTRRSKRGGARAGTSSWGRQAGVAHGVGGEWAGPVGGRRGALS